MQRSDPKCRCEKKIASKASAICRLYNQIQVKYLNVLDADASVESIRCNMPLENFTKGNYTSDFYCKKSDGTFMVRECVERKFLTKPMTVSLLDASREYWNARGITDWGLVIDKEASNEAQ